MPDLCALLAPMTRQEIIDTFTHRERMDMLMCTSDTRMSIVNGTNPFRRSDLDGNDANYAGGFLHDHRFKAASDAARKLRHN